METATDVLTCHCGGKGYHPDEILHIEGDWPGGVVLAYVFCEGCGEGEAHALPPCPACQGRGRDRSGLGCSRCGTLGKDTPEGRAWEQLVSHDHTEDWVW